MRMLTAGVWVRAPRPAVFDLFGTTEGLKSWFADGAEITLAAGMYNLINANMAGAVREVVAAVDCAGFRPLLLHGVTASGKTEVYLRAAHAAREAGGQTLVLVPEVAMGSQVVAAFRRRPVVVVFQQHRQTGEVELAR